MNLQDTIKESQNLKDKKAFNALVSHKLKIQSAIIECAFVSKEGDQITFEENYGAFGTLQKIVTLEQLELYFTEWAVEEIDLAYIESDELFEEFIDLYPSKELANHCFKAYWYAIYKQEWIENEKIIEREEVALLKNIV